MLSKVLVILLLAGSVMAQQGGSWNDQSGRWTPWESRDNVWESKKVPGQYKKGGPGMEDKRLTAEENRIVDLLILEMRKAKAALMEAIEQGQSKAQVNKKKAALAEAGGALSNYLNSLGGSDVSSDISSQGAGSVVNGEQVPGGGRSVDQRGYPQELKSAPWVKDMPDEWTSRDYPQNLLYNAKGEMYSGQRGVLGRPMLINDTLRMDGATGLLPLNDVPSRGRVKTTPMVGQGLSVLSILPEDTIGVPPSYGWTLNRTEDTIIVKSSDANDSGLVRIQYMVQ